MYSLFTLRSFGSLVAESKEAGHETERSAPVKLIMSNRLKIENSTYHPIEN